MDPLSNLQVASSRADGPASSAATDLVIVVLNEFAYAGGAISSCALSCSDHASLAIAA
jgi:hypothetical protein